jgi:hypothetical protein
MALGVLRTGHHKTSAACALDHPRPGLQHLARLPLLQTVSNSAETDKCLYLSLKSAAVSPFHGFGGIGRIIWTELQIIEIRSQIPARPLQKLHNSETTP